MQWLTVTHTRRWHAHYHSAGTGPLYQGRFKSFPIQQNHHLLKTCRYVERNALAAKLVDRAEAWPWNSAHKRQGKASCPWLLPGTHWPTPRPRNWLELINTPLPAKEHKRVEHSVNRGCPLGEEDWMRQTAEQLSLQSTLRHRGGQAKANT